MKLRDVGLFLIGAILGCIGAIVIFLLVVTCAIPSLISSACLRKPINKESFLIGWHLLTDKWLLHYGSSVFTKTDFVFNQITLLPIGWILGVFLVISDLLIVSIQAIPCYFLLIVFHKPIINKIFVFLPKDRPSTSPSSTDFFDLPKEAIVSYIAFFNLPEYILFLFEMPTLLVFGGVNLILSLTVSVWQHQLIGLLPEDHIANLNALLRRRQKQQISQWKIDCELIFREIIPLILVINFQIKLDNLLLKIGKKRNIN
jgi:hypothetical protein